MRLITIILILVSCCSHGQRFNAFLNGGVAASQVSGDGLGGFDKAGVSFSAGVITAMTEKLSIAMEIGYLQKGSRKPSRLDQGDPIQYLLRLNYIEVPVYLSYEAGKRLSLMAGPSVGVLLSALEENERGEIDYNPPFKSTDISITGGLQYYLSDQWAISLRTVQSVVPVREFGERAVPFLEGGQYNSVLVLSLACFFKKMN